MNSLRPATPITMSAAQLIALAVAIGGVGFSVGALYPRLLAIESALHDQGKTLASAVSALDRLTVIVDRIEQERGQ